MIRMDAPVTDEAGGTDDPPPPPPPPPPSEPPTGSSGGASGGVGAWFSSLRRSTHGRMFAGVAAGLAEQLGVPVLVVRAAFVVAAFAGIGVPIYLLAWVFLPTDLGRQVLGASRRGDLLALAVVGVAGLLLIDGVSEMSLLRLSWRLMPWALLLLGLALILRRNDGSAAPTQAPTPVPAPAASPFDETLVQQPDGTFVQPQVDPTLPYAMPRSAPEPVRPRERPVVGPLTWCAVLVVAGAMGIGAALGFDVFSPGLIAAVALVVFGAGLLLSAFVGRARGLLLPALALAIVLGGLGALDLRADVVGAPFQETISSEDQLPDVFRTTVGSSRLDLRQLTLGSDREVRIEHFGGNLDLGLPVDTTTEVELTTSYGEVQVHRPSMPDAPWGDPDLAKRWTSEGVPEEGAALDDDVATSDRWWSSLPTRSEVLVSGSVKSSLRRTFDNGSEHRLRVVVDLGVGRVDLYDPHWDQGSQPMRQPVQLCTEGGGPRGVVKPCGEVALAQRVPLCINEGGFLVDCREDREGTPDWPRVAACRGFTGDQQPCDQFGIEPAGVELVTVAAGEDDAAEVGAAEDGATEGGAVGDVSEPGGPGDTIAPLAPNPSPPDSRPTADTVPDPAGPSATVPNPTGAP